MLKGGDGSCSLLYLQVKCPQMTVTLATRDPSHLSQGDLCPMVAVPDTMQGGCLETVAIGMHRGCRDLLLKVMQQGQSFVVQSAASCSTTQVLWQSTN